MDDDIHHHHWLPSSDDESNELRRVRSKLEADAASSNNNNKEQQDKKNAVLQWHDSSDSDNDASHHQEEEEEKDLLLESSSRLVVNDKENKGGNKSSNNDNKRPNHHDPSTATTSMAVAASAKTQQQQHHRTNSASSSSSSSSTTSSMDKLFATFADNEHKKTLAASSRKGSNRSHRRTSSNSSSSSISTVQVYNKTSSKSRQQGRNRALSPKSSRPARGKFWSPPTTPSRDQNKNNDDDILSSSSLSSPESLSKLPIKKNYCSNPNNAKKAAPDRTANSNNNKHPSHSTSSSSSSSSPSLSPTTFTCPTSVRNVVAACKNPYAAATAKTTAPKGGGGVVAAAVHNPYAKKKTATAATATTTATIMNSNGGGGGAQAVLPVAKSNTASKYFASSSSSSLLPLWQEANPSSKPASSLSSSQPPQLSSSSQKDDDDELQWPLDVDQEMDNNQTIESTGDDGSADFLLRDDVMAQEQLQQQPVEDAAPNDSSATQAEQEALDCEDVQKIIDEELELQYASTSSATVEQQEMHQESPVFNEGTIDQTFGFAMEPSNQQTFTNNSNTAADQAQGTTSNVSGTWCSDDEQVDDYRDGIDTDERVPEVHPSLYVPPPYQHQPQPLVHFFSQGNRPMASRQRAPVAQLFEARIACFWKGKFDNFNHLQSEVSNTLAHSDDNVVVSAPTGAGKTAVFEMAMARFFAMDLQAASSSSRMANNMHHNNNNNNPRISRNRKIVYVAPSKALVEERYDDWSARLSAMRLGIEIVVVTGDGDPGESFRDIMSAHVILTTPEKWDSVTRRWTDNFFLFGSVKLLLLDEVHLLADASRGCCLESVVCRMKSIQLAARQIQTTQTDIEGSNYTNTSPEAINSVLRIVAVSATLPNIEDIAEFLTANEAHVFDESYRPVPLTTHVVALGNASDDSQGQYRFWNGLNREVPPIIHKFSKKRPTIVFCHAKRDTEQLADLLATANGIALVGNANGRIASETRVPKLQRVLIAGMAFHHAGMEADDRRLVERAFLSGKIRVMCATSTLAMGVNLPAHLVVIKGTRAWRGPESGYQELDQATLLQMIGRAGRPGFDTSGTAVIMTDNKSKPMYERMASSGLEPVKSQLLSRLNEVLNAEISQRVIADSISALNWIKHTLFFVQFNKDPLAYNIEPSASAVDAHLVQLCSEAFRRLRSIGVLIQREDTAVRPRDASHIMSQHLVDFATMGIISQLPFDATQCQVARAISHIENLQRPCRKNEKKTLNAAHKEIKFKLEGQPSKVRVQQPWEKSFVLLQSHIGQVAIEDYTLRQETMSMVKYASRVLVAAEEFSARSSRHGKVVVETLKLRRALATRVWCSQSGVLGQFSSLDRKTVSALKFNGISTFDDVLATKEETLEAVAKRTPPFGLDLRKVVSKVLASTLELTAEIEYAAGSTTPSALVCHLSVRDDIPNLVKDIGGSTNTPQVTYTLIAYTDRPGGCLMYKKNVSKANTFKVACPPRFGKVSVHIIASMIGLDEKVDLAGNSELAASSFAGVTGKGKTRKGRASNNKNAANLTAFGGDGVRGDPRIRGKKKATGTKVATSMLRQSFIPTQKAAPKPAKKMNVTPSPQPPPSGEIPTASVETRPPAETQREQETFASGQTLQTRQEPAPAPPRWQPQSHEDNSRHQHASVMTQSPMRQSALGGLDVASMYSQQSQDGGMQGHHHSATGYHAQRQGAALRQSMQPLSQPSRLPFRQPVQQSVVSRQHFSQPSQPASHRQAAHTTPQPASHRQVQTTPQIRPWGSTSGGTDEASWKKQKKVQQHSQSRAFSGRRENPFADYRCDPNNAESFLDSMASRSRSIDEDSVIPAKERDALQNAYPHFTPAFGASRNLLQQTSGTKRGGSVLHSQQSRRGGGGRRFHAISAIDVLAQKAAEMAPSNHDALRQEELYYQQQQQSQYGGYPAVDDCFSQPNDASQWQQVHAFSQQPTGGMYPPQPQEMHSMHAMAAVSQQQQQGYSPPMYTTYSQGQQQFHQEPMTHDHSPFFVQAVGGGPMSQMSQVEFMTNQQPFGQQQQHHHHHHHHPEHYHQSQYPAPVASVAQTIGHDAHGSFHQGAAAANAQYQHQPQFVTQSTQQMALAHQQHRHHAHDARMHESSSWENPQEFEDAFF